MKKHSNVLKTVIIVILLLPLVVSWLPEKLYYDLREEKKAQTYPDGTPVMIQNMDENGDPVFEEDGTPQMVVSLKKEVTVRSFIPESLFQDDSKSEKEIKNDYYGFLKFMDQVFISFRKLSLILVSTLICAMIFSVILGYLSVLSMSAGRGFANILSAFESIPSIIIALFCYVPVSGVLSNGKANAASWVSLMVFVAATTVTVLPEAVRSISIPLSDLYNRKYSVSFRSYGFTKNRILSVLMKTSLMKDTLKRVAAAILLKTLVLDTSFGYVVQLGFGENGSPQHTSPGSLIAAYRSAIFGSSDYPSLYFWIPALIVIAISVAFLLILGNKKEEA